MHFTSHHLYAIGDAATRKAVEEENRPYDERHPDERPRDRHPPMKRAYPWFRVVSYSHWPEDLAELSCRCTCAGLHVEAMDRL